MVIVTLTALLLAQPAPPTAPGSLRMIAAAAPTANVGDRILLEPGTAVAGGLADLRALLLLATDPDLDAPTRGVRYGLMLRSGRALELPTRVAADVEGLAQDDRFRDDAGRPLRAYAARVRGGPLAGRLIHAFAFQVDKEPLPKAPPPTALERERAESEARVRADRDFAVYPRFVVGLKAARLQAGAADASVRRSTLRRRLDDLAGRLTKEFSLAPGELEEIVARGQWADGTAARLAKAAAREQARDRVEADLAIVGSVVDRGTAWAVANGVRPIPLSLAGPSTVLALPAYIATPTPNSISYGTNNRRP